jgi:N-acetylmuramoyl-L-alanine amidase
MPTEHVVRQGDCLSKLARRYGLSNWRTIYEHPNNADFRTLRPDPNVIYPGDRIFIPDREERTEACATEQRHRFRRRGDETCLRLWLQDEEGESLEGATYRLEVGPRLQEGQVGPDGLVELSIDPQEESGLLIVCPDESTPEATMTWQLGLGGLDPVDTTSGIQARLNNLGFNSGSVDGIDGPLTQEAVRGFQEEYGLQVDGIAGPETQAKLEEVHKV